ncbi:hypothetical protein F5141DRAFT_1094261 [Pisolithus sp. B1]|nr:hypothetical protein F5141DRAFT_1094261 [Pisolithus sp. B1]
MPKVANPASRLSVRRKASARADSLIEQMAKRNAFYLQMFDQHADLVRGEDAEEVTNAYHRVMNRGIASDSTSITDGDLDAMEQILCTPTATFDEYAFISHFHIHELTARFTRHVFVGLTAHSLLLSQMEAMKKLPHDIMVKVDALTIELRSQPSSEIGEACRHPPYSTQQHYYPQHASFAIYPCWKAIYPSGYGCILLYHVCHSFIDVQSSI